MSNFKCNKCNNVLAEIGIPPQIQMLQRYNNVINTGEQVSEEIKNDPFVYKGLYCPSCNKVFCPPCAKMQSQICPECGQAGLMPAYRPLLKKITVAPAFSSCSHTLKSKDKTPAVLLAVFLGFWTWCYTYKKDAWKFWLNLGLSVVSIGFWAPVAWIWAVVDAVRRPKEFYANFNQAALDQTSKCNLEQKDRKSRSSKVDIIKAVQNRDMSNITNYITNGGDVNLKDQWGNTPLVWGVHYGHTDVVKILIDAKADVNAKDVNDQSALMKASDKGHTNIAKILISANADVNAKDIRGQTALIMASQNGHRDVVKLLIDAKANVKTKDNEGLTALMWAKLENHNNVIGILETAGALE